MSISGESDPIHVALMPSSGMGHLNQFLRLAVSLMNQSLQVTIITTYPTVSLAESETLSQFFSCFPKISQKQLHLLPFDSSMTEYKDPFHVQYQAICQSSHLLLPILSSSPNLSALITDMSLASTVIPVTQSISLPNYIFFTTSATMLMVFLSYGIMDGSITGRRGTDSNGMEVFEIPGLQPIPLSWLPPAMLLDENTSMKTDMIEITKGMIGSSGILTNTFEALEQESLAALNDSRVVDGLPPVIPIGPLAPFDFKQSQSQALKWLDDQLAGSVVYASFGSRAAMSVNQIKELGNGLLCSECKFLWVVKEKKIDQEDDKELDEVVGEEFKQDLQGKGLVVRNWVDQVAILSHPAVGGFMSHCGWNSVTEALWNGVPILAWPQHADQKINASVLKRMGSGLWEESWEWGGGEVAPKAAEIGEKVKEMMTNEILKEKAAEIGGQNSCENHCFFKTFCE